MAKIVKVNQDSKFYSENEKIELMESYTENFFKLKIKNSHSLEQIRPLRSYNNDLKYYRLTLQCINEGKGQGRSKKTNCPFKLCLILSKNGKYLEISKLIYKHNHDIKREARDFLLDVPDGMSDKDSIDNGNVEKEKSEPANNEALEKGSVEKTSVEKTDINIISLTTPVIIMNNNSPVDPKNIQQWIDQIPPVNLEMDDSLSNQCLEQVADAQEYLVYNPIETIPLEFKQKDNVDNAVEEKISESDGNENLLTGFEHLDVQALSGIEDHYEDSLVLKKKDNVDNAVEDKISESDGNENLLTGLEDLDVQAPHGIKDHYEDSLDLQKKANLYLYDDSQIQTDSKIKSINLEQIKKMDLNIPKRRGRGAPKKIKDNAMGLGKTHCSYINSDDICKKIILIRSFMPKNKLEDTLNGSFLIDETFVDNLTIKDLNFIFMDEDDNGVATVDIQILRKFFSTDAAFDKFKNLVDLKKVKDVARCCICKEEEKENELWVQCDGCLEWAHCDCVRIDPSVLKKKLEYFCFEC